MTTVYETGEQQSMFDARKWEAEGTVEEIRPPNFLHIEHAGNVYTIDADKFDLETLERLEEAPLSALRDWLGEDQWKQFKDSARDARGRVPIRSLEPLVKKVMEQVGKYQESD